MRTPPAQSTLTAFCSILHSSRPNSYQGLSCPAKDWAVQPGIIHGQSSLAGNGGHLLVGPPPWWQSVQRRRPRICIGFGAWPIGQVEPKTTIMIYDAKISWDGGAVLYMDELTKGVLIPLKEACSGIGCMGMGATFLGLRCISSIYMKELF